MGGLTSLPTSVIYSLRACVYVLNILLVPNDAWLWGIIYSMPYTNICVHLCVLKSMFGRAAACPTALGCNGFGGLAHRGREFLQFWTETEEGLTVESKLLQTLDGGSDNLQSKWAAAEGDSVSGGNGTARISPSN